MSDTPTPRTDNETFPVTRGEFCESKAVSAAFAGQLEWELQEAVRCLRQINAECDLRDECGSDIDDAARAILARYKE
jgi:hypothetical protein